MDRNHQPLATDIEPTWQQELRRAYRQPAELLRFLNLEGRDEMQAKLAQREFSMLVPRPYARRIEVGNPLDPLLLQVLPQGQEMKASPGFLDDPLAEAKHSPLPGLIHKYRGRVLLITAGGCAVNCRYCFRRHYDYSANQASQDNWEQALRYIAADASIDEVLLSGGDPLLQADSSLQNLVQQLESITHLKRLRIHSRLPIVLPSRVNSGLLNILDDTRLDTVMVIHSNHAQELAADVATALQELTRVGCRLLNQSVLLRGVNDSADSLQQLSERLWQLSVQPYYLHLLDPVRGAAHFDIPEPLAQSIYKQLCEQTSGYLVPRLVREIPGEASKTPLAFRS
jgi:EF-P beta-lysylation protein EpmB